jgi:hypothetical protein
MIKNFDLNTIYGEANKVLQKPMLKPYKKDWDKYLLAPTKDFCDTVKYLSYKINWYWSYSCSDEEYNDMLKESVIGWDLYIIVDWSDKHLWFEVKQYWVDSYIKIYSWDKKIEKLLFKIVTTAWIDKWNNAELIYINWQKLDFILNLIKESVNVSFKSLLTSDNKFSKIDYTTIASQAWFKSNFKLENRKFNGSLAVDNNDIKVVWKLTWELNSSNDLTSFDLQINSLAENEEYNYDWETWESNYVPTKTVFDLKYNLKNEIITWNISLKENDKEFFSVKSNWKYRKEYFELNNAITLNNYTNTGDINWNLNTKFIWNLENNKFDLYIDVYSNMWYIKFNLTTDSKVEYKNDIKIEAPTNYKTIDTLTQEEGNLFFE